MSSGGEMVARGRGARVLPVHPSPEASRLFGGDLPAACVVSLAAVIAIATVAAPLGWSVLQNMATNAAREGARMRALGYTTAQATDRVNGAMIGISSASFTVQYDLVQGAAGTVTPNGNCPTTAVITDRQRVTVVPAFSFIFPLPSPTTPVLSSKAEMRCGG